MRYLIGDLVMCNPEAGRSASPQGQFGIVVGYAKANGDSYDVSVHSYQLVERSADIYYVFFSDSKFQGPYYASELKLEQTCHG